MKITIAELSEQQGVTGAIANGLIGFLLAKGLATKTDEMRTSKNSDGKQKRGRPSKVYEVSETLTINLGK
jgi:predicted ArsR family transcriptional regulator